MFVRLLLRLALFIPVRQPAWTWLLVLLPPALGSEPLLAQPSVPPPSPSAVQPPAQPSLPLPTDPNTFDRLVVDTLRDVHNLGAELYNTSRDYAGTYRLYHGALLTVRPLLSHRPAVQQRIEQGLQEVEREPTLAHKAFYLHVVIEDIRSELKKTASAPKPPEKKPNTPPPPQKQEKKSQDNILPPKQEKKSQDSPPRQPQEKKSSPLPAENKLLSLPVAPPPRPALK